MRLRSLALAVAVIGHGCDSEPALPARWPVYPKTIVEHDFGSIPHCDVATAELVIPTPGECELGFPVPVAFLRDCSCARHEFIIVDADGNERIADGRKLPQNAVRAGEKLLLRLKLLTAEKEADDLAAHFVRGEVILHAERPESNGEAHAQRVKVQFRFGIDAPIDLRPVAHLDVGDLPRAKPYTQDLELVPDQPVRFGEIRCLAPSPNNDGQLVPSDELAARIVEEDGATILRVTVEPSRQRIQGPFAMSVEIDTDLDGYVLRVPVSGTVVPDIELSAPGHFNFGQIDFTEPSEQLLFVTDHDSSRPAEFELRQIVDTNGVDLSEHFALEVEPIDTNPRRHRLILQYAGTLERPYVRGHVHLTKPGEQRDAQVITLSAFNRRRS